MKKALLLTPLAVLALASCTDNEFLGSEEAQHTINGDKAISFESGASATTRADITGSAAAALLGKNYVVFGVKGNGTTQTKVFDHYNINWTANTAGSTETNVADWEYVGQTPHTNNTLASGAKQSIKYWDYATSQYDFIAFSYGKAGKTNANSDPILSTITPANLGKAESTNTPVYTVSGKVSDLTKTYVADLVTAYKADNKYNETVTPKFRQMGTKVRIAIYETVPGYVVKDVTFYYSNNRLNKSLMDDDTTPKPVLYAVQKVTNAAGKTHMVPIKALPKSKDGEGTISVYFPTVGYGKKADTDYNKAHVVFTSKNTTDPTADKTSTLEFKQLQYNSVTEGSLIGSYIGQASNTATYAGDVTADANAYEMVLPYGAGTDLKLHVDYTLLSVDGSGEEIHVTSASALVPSVYTNWQPNYAYTYIFKISKNSNGTTGGPDVPGGAGDPDDPNNPGNDPTDPDNPDPLNPSGLYPIVFDAVVMDFDNGIQETITTVSDPSITTYAKGVEPTATPEYPTGKNIYICLENPGAATLTSSNTKLYTVTVEDGALQAIDEGSVANAIKNGKPYKEKTVAVGESVDGLYTYNAESKLYVACASTDVAAEGKKYYEWDSTIMVVYDAAGKAMIVTATNNLSIKTEIDAADATDGNAIAGNFAMFTPNDAGTYVFEYIVPADGTDPEKKYYKIIIVH